MPPPAARPQPAGPGLPGSGPGSPASVAARLLAYLVDAVASTLVAGLFVRRPDDPQRGLLTLAVFLLEYLVLVSTTGQTLGMRLTRLRVVRLAAPDQVPGLLPVAVRTALLSLLVPAVVIDRYGRGLHDRAAGTVVVRAAGSSPR